MSGPFHAAPLSEKEGITTIVPRGMFRSVFPACTHERTRFKRPHTSCPLDTSIAQVSPASMENRFLTNALTVFERHNELVLALLEAHGEVKCQLSAEEMAKKHFEEENENLRKIIRTDKVSLAEMQNVITLMEKQLLDLQALYSDAIKISLKARISEDKMPHILAEVSQPKGNTLIYYFKTHAEQNPKIKIGAGRASTSAQKYGT